MATVDLTEKLGLAGRPVLKIKDVELTVNNSARNVLQLMTLVGGGDVEPTQILDAMEILFSAEDLEKLDALNLDFRDLTVVLQEAMDLVAGEVAGEAETLDTTLSTTSD